MKQAQKRKGHLNQLILSGRFGEVVQNKLLSELRELSNF